jgi:transposase
MRAAAVATIALFVGIDVSKATLEVFIRPVGETLKISNTAAGIATLCARLKNLAPTLVVLEATAGLERAAARALAAAGIPIAVVNPRRVRDFAKALDILAKTDRIDRRVIAHFAEVVRPEPRPLPDQATLDRDALQTRRRQVVEFLAIERNHLANAPESVRANIVEVIKYFEHLIADLDARLRAMIEADERLRAKREVLISAKGIGQVTAAMLLTQVPELGLLTGKQIAKLVGVAPLNNDSGEREGKRVCWGGRADVRTALFMPTLTATRCNPVVKALYERLIAKGKPFKVVMIACMRKLLTILNAMVRDNTLWNVSLALSN